jgi:hypothetical protein
LDYPHSPHSSSRWLLSFHSSFLCPPSIWILYVVSGNIALLLIHCSSSSIDCAYS